MEEQEEKLNPLGESPEQFGVIAQRQKWYWLGRDHQEAGRLEEAMAAFREYATVLDEADRVYPWMWVAEIQEQLHNPNAELEAYRMALGFSLVKVQQDKLKKIIKELEKSVG